MRSITKNSIPPLLLAHKKTAHSNYDNLPQTAKAQLRNSLLSEQGQLCCYCMKRIRDENMKIEHWQCQSVYPHLQLDYWNILVACNGNMGQPQHMQHCDTKKRDTDLSINPADSSHHCELRVKFSSNGEVYSDDNALDAQLNEVLNLNMQTLKDNRKIFLFEAIKELATRHPKGTWKKALLDKEIARWNVRGGGLLNEYCQVIINYLDRKIAIGQRNPK